jgi:hypothetical protein
MILGVAEKQKRGFALGRSDSAFYPSGFYLQCETWNVLKRRSIELSEDEPLLNARISASFLTKLFRHVYPADFQFRISGLHRLGDQFSLRSSNFC